jgi:hypothetical protein
MLRIRDEQYDALLQAVREHYVDRMLLYFRRHWAEECAGLVDPALREVIITARDRAEGYGIDVEADVVRFTAVWLLLGEDFDLSDRYPWAPAILKDDEADGTIKVTQLAAAARDVLAQRGNRI